MTLCFFNVFNRNEANATIVIINDQQLFDAEFMKKAFCLIHIDPIIYRDQFFFGHQGGNLFHQIRRESDVAVRQNPNQFLAATFDDRNS